MAKKDAKGKDFGRNNFVNNQQTESYRQQLKKEAQMANVRTQAEIDRLQPMFTVNNQYINIHKREEAQDNQLLHTTIKKKGDDKIISDAQTIFKVPLTSSQAYGWRKPIDDSNFGHGCKFVLQTFKSMRSGDEKKPSAN